MTARSRSCKAAHAAAILVLEQHGAQLTVFPQAGLWPGPRLADLWTKRRSCMRWATLASRMITYLWSKRRSCMRLATLTSRMLSDHCIEHWSFTLLDSLQTHSPSCANALAMMEDPNHFQFWGFSEDVEPEPVFGLKPTLSVVGDGLSRSFDASVPQAMATDRSQTMPCMPFGSSQHHALSSSSANVSAMVGSPSPSLAIDEHKSDYQCEQGLVARMVSHFGG